MQQIASLLYLFFLLGVAIAAIFVVYHISKYSLSKTNAFWGNTVFLSGLVILIGINALIFFQIDWSAVAFDPGVSAPLMHKPLW